MLQHLLQIAVLGTALTTVWCNELSAVNACAKHLSVDPKARDGKQIRIGSDQVAPETSTIMEAYAYYYPLYAFYRAMVVPLYMRADSIGTVKNNDAPIMQSTVPRPSMAAVYSSVFLDQDKGPFKVTYPVVPENETFLSVSILDMYTEQLLPSINNQFNSTNLSGSFELHGSNSSAGLMSVMSESATFTCQTKYCWVVLRFFVSDQSTEELEKIKKWQSEIRVENVNGDEYQTEITPSMLQGLGQAGASVESFFTLVNDLSLSSPPQPSLPSLLDSFERYGIGPGLEFDISTLSPQVQEEIRAIPSCFEEVMLNTNLGTEASPGWKYAIDGGRYGDNYPERAYMALNGLGATIPRDIVYASHDALDAKFAYRMDFTPDTTPETYAWSMQIYNLTGNIEKNPEGIYDINSRSRALNRTEDGSVTILFQKNEPDALGAPGINWMPTSGYEDGESFLPLIRFYVPGESILSKEYPIPEISKLTVDE